MATSLLESRDWMRYPYATDSLESGENVEKWKYKNRKLKYCVYVRNFLCGWGYMNLVTIDKTSFYGMDKEPNMSEKRFILNSLSIMNSQKIAVEVFPKKSKIIDKKDLYHIWVMDKENFPYHMDKRKIEGFKKWEKVEVKGKTFFYKVEKKCLGKTETQIYFIKEKKSRELTWYEKQNFKDQVIGQDAIAVEYVDESNKNISILVCVPSLIFGLK